jgi:DNA-binding transcriptional regulator YhcF (GntR family)
MNLAYFRKGRKIMVIELDMDSATPIYVQLRNQVVKGIGKGELVAGEKLPTVRQLAEDAGINTMTVNKAYQILKAEGYIKIDRRAGAYVATNIDTDLHFREKLESELELLSAEASITGMSRLEFLEICNKIYSTMKPVAQ